MSGTVGPSTGSAQVRDIVASVVQAALAPYAVKTYRARVYPLKAEDFPCALIYGFDENMTFQTMDFTPTVGANVCQMVVQVASRFPTPETAERGIEIFIGAARSAVLQSAALVGDGGAIERILSVRTSRVIKAESDDILAESTMIFEMQWSELYTLAMDVMTEIDITTGTAPAAMTLTPTN